MLLHAMRRLGVFSRLLPGHVHTQGVPRVEGFATILAAGTREDTLLRGGRRRTSDMAQMLFETSLGEQPLAVRALSVFWRLPHLLSPAVSFTVMVFPARPRSAALLLPPWPRGVKRRSAATVTSARMTHRTHKVYGSLASRHDAGVFVNRVILDTWCCWPRCWRIACSIALTIARRADAHRFARGEE